jgi:hypothetical protein
MNPDKLIERRRLRREEALAKVPAMTHPTAAEIHDAGVEELCKLAIAFEKAHAKEMAESASAYLLARNIRFWISPRGDSITCIACRMTSNNPNDVENRYCGNCHKFHEGS